MQHRRMGAPLMRITGLPEQCISLLCTVLFTPIHVPPVFFLHMLAFWWSARVAMCQHGASRSEMLQPSRAASLTPETRLFLGIKLHLYI